MTMFIVMWNSEIGIFILLLWNAISK